MQSIIVTDNSRYILDVDNRLKLNAALSEKGGERNNETVCNVFQMNEFKLLTGKQSASNTMIAFGSILMPGVPEENSSVALKISTVNIGDFEATVYEKDIYQKYVNGFLRAKITPHLIAFVAYSACEGFFDQVCQQSHDPWWVSITRRELPYTALAKNMVKYMESHIKFGRTYFFPGEPVDLNIKCADPRIKVINSNIVITERSQGPNLEEKFGLRSQRFLLDNLWHVFVQTLYTIWAFAETGLTHNDLHGKNIFIDEMNEEKYIIYFISQTEYIMLKTRFVAKLYDFDQSVMVDRPNPRFIDEKSDKVNTRFTPLKDIKSLLKNITAITNATLPTNSTKYLYPVVKKTFDSILTKCKQDLKVAELQQTIPSNPNVNSIQDIYTQYKLPHRSMLETIVTSFGSKIFDIFVDGYDKRFDPAKYPYVFYLPSVNKGEIEKYLANDKKWAYTWN